MNRRGFLGAILAAAASPAIVRADALMRIQPPEKLTFNVLGRYDLEGWFESFVVEADNKLMTRSTKIIVPQYAASLAASILSTKEAMIFSISERAFKP